MNTFQFFSGVHASHSFQIHGFQESSAVPLSGFDVAIGNIGLSAILVFQETLEPEALRRSLTETLKNYPLLTGRLVRGKQGHPEVCCNDAGIRFQVAHSWRRLPKYGPYKTAKQKIFSYTEPIYPWRVLEHDTPLLSIRLTQFRGGGSILGVSVTHSIVDGFSISEFMRAWAKRNQGKSHPLPRFDRAPLDQLGEGYEDTVLEQEKTDSWDKLRLLGKFSWIVARGLLSPNRIFRYTAEDLKAIRETLAPDVHLTKHDLVTASLWKEMTLARKAPHVSELMMIQNLRSIREVNIPRNYVGNAATAVYLDVPSQNLEEASLSEIGQKVRQGIIDLSMEDIRKLAAELTNSQSQGEGNLMSEEVLDLFINKVMINNWSRFSMYNIDFGSGSPIWFDIPPNPMSRVAIIISTPEKDGGFDVHLTLPRAEMDRFAKRHKARRFLESTCA